MGLRVRHNCMTKNKDHLFKPKGKSKMTHIMFLRVSDTIRARTEFAAGKGKLSDYVRSAIEEKLARDAEIPKSVEGKRYRPNVTPDTEEFISPPQSTQPLVAELVEEW